MVATLGCILLVGYAALPAMRDATVVRASGAVNWQYKNATMASYNEFDLYNSVPALQQLARTGANSVTFTVTWYTSNVYSTDIFRTGATASDAALIYAMQQAQSLGLMVMLKPHLDSQQGQWRAYINPSDADQWFSNYTAFLDHYADIGNQYHAVLLCVGAELISMSTNTAYESKWRALIAHERARFGGLLTYSGNWGAGDGAFQEEFTRIPFWDALDYLGISAYFYLAITNTPTVASLNASWATWKAHLIAPFQQKWGKPLLFTEGGYRSLDGAAQHPWDASSSGPSDQGEQADCYEALFESWGNVSWFAGAMVWFWSPNANADPNDTDYEVQNKAAYNTVSAWFKQFPASATPTPTRSWTVTSTATPAPHATSVILSTQIPVRQPPRRDSAATIPATPVPQPAWH